MAPVASVSWAQSSGKNPNALLPLELRPLLRCFGLGVFLLVPIITLLSVIYRESLSPRVAWRLLVTMVLKSSSLALVFRGLPLGIRQPRPRGAIELAQSTGVNLFNSLDVEEWLKQTGSS